MYIFIILCFTLFIICLCKTRRKYKVSIPFEDTFNTHNVPIITLCHNNKPYNFLVDTGGDTCFIDKECLNDMEYQEVFYVDRSIGTANGSIYTEGKIKTSMDYKDTSLDVNFIVLNMRESMDNTFPTIKIHGIIGDSFLRKHHALINFENLSLELK